MELTPERRAEMERIAAAWVKTGTDPDLAWIAAFISTEDMATVFRIQEGRVLVEMDLSAEAAERLRGTALLAPSVELAIDPQAFRVLPTERAARPDCPECSGTGFVGPPPVPEDGMMMEPCACLFRTPSPGPHSGNVSGKGPR